MIGLFSHYIDIVKEHFQKCFCKFILIICNNHARVLAAVELI